MRFNIFFIALSIISFCKAQSLEDSLEHQEPVDSLILCPDSSMSFLMQRQNANETPTISLPDITYKCPEAMSFERYGEYNVGEYTGNAQISVPLYNIKCRDIEMPLVLTYQGSGIKVDEEASWVGLGWNLAVGGCISLIPSGALDNGVMSSSWSNVMGLINENSSDYFSTTKYWTPIWSYPYSDYVESSLKEDIERLGEPDIYSVNVLGKSFYFFIDRENNQPRIIGYNNENFVVERRNLSWIVKDGNGYVYMFDKCLNGATSSGAQYISAWFLTEITSPQNSSLSISYSANRAITNRPKMNECYDFVDYIGDHFSYSTAYNCNYSIADSNMEQSLVTRITTEEHVIDFELTEREDMECMGGNSALKLSSITIKSAITNKTIKNLRFNYSYFTSNTCGGSWLEEKGFSSLASSDYYSKRLKLLSVSDVTDENEPLTHNFTYYENIGLPNKASYAVDYWGYFNGKNNTITSSAIGGHTFIPTTAFTCLGANWQSINNVSAKRFEGANRMCSPEHAVQGCLKRITYPTKGYTVFTFEPHTFINEVAYPCAESDYVNFVTYSCVDNNAAGANNTRSITFDKPFTGILRAVFTANSNAGYSINDMKNAQVAVLLQQTNVPSPYSCRLNLQNVAEDLVTRYSYSMEQEVNLPAGTYMLNAYLPNNIGTNTGISVSGSLRGHSDLASGINITSIGGGLRIKSIANYESDGTLQTIETYDYNLEDGNTSGKLILPVKMYQAWSENEVVNDIPYGCNIYRLSSCSSGLPAITNILNSGSIGYSSVTKRTTNGVVTTTFSNTKPQVFGPMYIFSENSLGNGNVLTTTTKGANGVNVLKVTNAYSKDVTVIKTNIYAYSSGFGRPLRMPLYVYPFYEVWNKQISSTTTYYDDSGSVNMETIKTIGYNDANRQVNYIEETSEHSDPVSTTYQYTVDFPNNSILRMMVSENMLNNIIAENRYNGNTCIYKKKYNYANCHMNYLPTAEFYAPTGDYLEKRLDLDYDSYGNLIFAKKDYNDNVVYLWAYNNLYPVAKIEGISYSELQNYVSSTFINNLARATDSTIIKSSTDIVRQNLSSVNCLVTSYTFDPLVGITSITAPNGKVTTYMYDSRHRLSEIVDDNGSSIQKFHYNYKN